MPHPGRIRLHPTGRFFQKAILILEDQTVFEGLSCGAPGETGGEIVFNTSMTGYQEILTDPSYCGQIVTMTYPLIGNTGSNPEDAESSRSWVEGFVVKEMAALHSNWRADESLRDYLLHQGIVSIEGIDTRKLTKILRNKGSQRALISTVDFDRRSLLRKVKRIPFLVGADLVQDVTAAEPYQLREGLFDLTRGTHPKKSFKHFVVAYDFGIKRNILRSLTSSAIDVLVVPAAMPWREVLGLKPDGVFLSNGPGDPEPLSYAIDNIRNLAGKIPIFGICLGHQLLGLALGAKTYKLKFGHHGANHPVKNMETGAVEITSQNHGFAVKSETLPSEAKLTHVNLNDQTVEGFSWREKFLFSVQYHPESSPGPHDSRYLFQDFVRMIGDFKGK